MNVLKKKRKEFGLSQKEMSEKLGISQQTVSRLEKTEIKHVSLGLLMKLTDIFQLPLEVLIYDEQNSFSDNEGRELWEIYKKLNETNKRTLLLLGRRLQETQKEKM